MQKVARGLEITVLLKHYNGGNSRLLETGIGKIFYAGGISTH
jgi:hypothetical protein